MDFKYFDGYLKNEEDFVNLVMNDYCIESYTISARFDKKKISLLLKNEKKSEKTLFIQAYFEEHSTTGSRTKAVKLYKKLKN